jgi:dihydroorotase
LACVTVAPVRVLGDALGSLEASAGRLVDGGVADVCIFDPADHWRVTPQALRSQGKHTPFAGHELAGRVRFTVVSGQVAFEAP